MGRRCRSWRYHHIADHAGHRPGGSCRRCWTPCHQVIPKDDWIAGTRRCDGCTDALLFSPDVHVRRALVDEPDISDAVLGALVTDSNGPIALTAQRLLDERAAARDADATDTLTQMLGDEDAQTPLTGSEPAVSSRRSVW